MADLTLRGVPQPAPDGGVVVLEVEGEVDLDTVAVLRSRLEEADRRGEVRLVMDLDKTTYVNSSALAVLVRFARSFQERGGGMALVHVSARVRLVFEMLGLHPFFTFFDSIEMATRSLAHGPG